MSDCASANNSEGFALQVEPLQTFHFSISKNTIFIMPPLKWFRPFADTLGAHSSRAVQPEFSFHYYTHHSW